MEREKKAAFKDRFETCETCRYRGGFHILLERPGSAGEDEVKLKLKCPSCSQVYDLALFCSIR